MSYPFYLFPVTGLSGQSLSATTSATVAFSAFPTAQFVEVSVALQNVYATFDGSTPSAQNGLVIAKDQPALVWPIDRALTAKLRGVADTAIVYGAPMVTYATRTETPILSAALQMLSSYPVNPGF